MPGKPHVHEGLTVYHRPDGAFTFHNVKHARLMPGRDRKLPSENQSIRGYPHSGDRVPKKKSKSTKRRSTKKKCKCKKGKKGK